MDHEKDWEYRMHWKQISYSFLLTYLTLHSRVLLEKLTGFQLVKKLPAFYRTQKFITAFTSAHHLSLSWSSSCSSFHFLKIHRNIILPSTPGSLRWSLCFRFPHQNAIYTSPLPHTCYMLRQFHSSPIWSPEYRRFILNFNPEFWTNDNNPKAWKWRII